MIARAAAALLAIATFLGCAQQSDSPREEEGSSMTLHPIAKARAKARAEAFLRAYVPRGWQNFPLQRITRRAGAPGGTYWIVYFSGKDIHTGIYVEVQEQTGFGRIRGFLGNVLVEDNASAATTGAANPFRSLEDFRARLAAQQLRYQQAQQNAANLAR